MHGQNSVLGWRRSLKKDVVSLLILLHSRFQKNGWSSMSRSPITGVKDYHRIALPNEKLPARPHAIVEIQIARSETKCGCARIAVAGVERVAAPAASRALHLKTGTQPPFNFCFADVEEQLSQKPHLGQRRACKGVRLRARPSAGRRVHSRRRDPD
jgi:hypothetical protein